MTIYIHIGTHKTGTTSIQEFLYANRVELQTKSYYYPAIKDNSNAYPAQHSVVAHLLWKGQINTAKAIIETALDDAKRIGARHIILSGEDFSALSEQSVEELRAFLDGEDVIVLVWFRNLWEYVRAQYNQYQRYSDVVVDATYAKRYLEMFDPTRIISRWERVFGEDRVMVNLFDKRSGNVVVNFLEAVGLDEGAATVANSSHNSSIDFLAAELINRLFRHRDLRCKYRLNLLCQELIRHTPNVIKEAERHAVDALFRELSFDVSHPKLRPFQEQLMKGPKDFIVSQDTDEEIAAYLQTIARFIGEASKL